MSKDNHFLEFISQENFENHVCNTIKQYNQTLTSINLKRFNSNIIDPIKLLFDKNVFDKDYKDIIELEIQRQRDKSNSNIIGYFHQRIFEFIKDCEVPKQGWDIIYKPDNGKTIYVEMKNKHNTMNSSSSAKTYMRFQNHLLNSEDKDNSICALVEIIAKKSSNEPWVVSVDGLKQDENANLRRISIDKFYEIVTGDRLAFRKICEQLPITIEKILLLEKQLKVEEDTVYKELLEIDNDILIALYKLAFKTYEGFDWK